MKESVVDELFKAFFEVRQRHPGVPISRVTIGANRLRRLWEAQEPTRLDPDLLSMLPRAGAEKLAREDQRRVEEWYGALTDMLGKVGQDEPAGALIGVPCYIVPGDGLEFEEPASVR